MQELHKRERHVDHLMAKAEITRRQTQAQLDACAARGTRSRRQFEIRIDGTPRSYRNRKDYAMEAAPIEPRGDLGEAEAQYQKSWDEWKAWAKLEEID